MALSLQADAPPPPIGGWIFGLDPPVRTVLLRSALQIDGGSADTQHTVSA